VAEKKKIIDAKNDEKGNISHVKLKGNRNYMSLDKAIEMTEQGKIDAVVVKPSNGDKHLRTRPDSTSSNNLDDMAEN